MVSERQNGLLQDMLDSAKQIQFYLMGVTKEAFVLNIEKQDAVLRRFEIIGEAANRLSPETQNLFPHLPFRNMRGMRNIIAHDYGAVDIEQVWHTANVHLEVLIKALQKYFDDLKTSTDQSASAV
jgi:uncharacterized protein with HEPN domain